MINFETSYARIANETDRRVYADAMPMNDWRILQETYQIGDLLMPCCEGAAVPKTSPLGLQFFAHYSGQCTSAPETVWHQRAKEAVCAAAQSLGLRAAIEHTSSAGWRADVWIDVPDRPTVVELQHSYQHLREFSRRQERYNKCGVRCFWLVTTRHFRTLQKSTYRFRAKADFGGKALPLSEGACLPSLPAASLILDPEPTVHGLDLHADLETTLMAFCEERLIWSQGRWLINGKPIAPPWAH